MIISFHAYDRDDEKLLRNNQDEAPEPTSPDEEDDPQNPKPKPDEE